MSKILAVVSSTLEFEKVGYRTGLWLGELTHFWDVAEENGVGITIVSTAGGAVPIDPESLLLSELGESVGIHTAVLKRYESRTFMSLLRSTLSIAEVSAQDYDGIYLTGGHGAMFDFRNGVLSALVKDFFESGKIVSAVCHGPAGLVDVILSNGDYLLANRKATGFSWNEEIMVKRDKIAPFSLEETMVARGAHYSKALLPSGVHVVEDGQLITGQNPVSAHAVGESVMKKLGIRA